MELLAALFLSFCSQRPNRTKITLHNLYLKDQIYEINKLKQVYPNNPCVMSAVI